MSSCRHRSAFFNAHMQNMSSLLRDLSPAGLLLGVWGSRPIRPILRTSFHTTKRPTRIRPILRTSSDTTKRPIRTRPILRTLFHKNALPHRLRHNPSLTTFPTQTLNPSWLLDKMIILRKASRSNHSARSFGKRSFWLFRGSCSIKVFDLAPSTTFHSHTGNSCLLFQIPQQSHLRYKSILNSSPQSQQHRNRS